MLGLVGIPVACMPLSRGRRVFFLSYSLSCNDFPPLVPPVNTPLVVILTQIKALLIREVVPGEVPSMAAIPCSQKAPRRML